LQGKSNLNLSSFTVPSGYYYVCITGLQDTIWSKPIVVVSERKPIIYEQPVSEQVCKGMDAIFEVGAGNNSNISYSWFSFNREKLPSDSSICYLSTVTEFDSIYAIASNTCGSTYSDTVKLTLFPVLEPSLGNDTALYLGDSLLIDPGIDFKFYKWSNGSIAQHIYAYPGDTIWLEVTDSNNCIGRDTMITYSLPVANIISARSGVRFIAFPNPAKDKLYINLAYQTPYIIKILSLDGKLVYETITRKEQYLTLDVSGFLKGIYLISIRSEFTNEILKLILQ
jgi:hypothetical protein